MIKYNWNMTESTLIHLRSTLNVSRFTYWVPDSVDILKRSLQMCSDVLNTILTWSNQLPMIVAPCIWKMRTWLRCALNDFELSLHSICTNVWQRIALVCKVVYLQRECKQIGHYLKLAFREQRGLVLKRFFLFGKNRSMFAGSNQARSLLTPSSELKASER